MAERYEDWPGRSASERYPGVGTVSDGRAPERGELAVLPGEEGGPGARFVEAGSEKRFAEERLEEQVQRLASLAESQVEEVAACGRNAAARAAADARGQVQRLVERRRAEIARQLGGLAAALRESAEALRRQDGAALGDYVDKVAGRVRRGARYLRDHDHGDLGHDLAAFAGRRPKLFAGGTFLAGFLLARRQDAKEHMLPALALGLGLGWLVIQRPGGSARPQRPATGRHARAGAAALALGVLAGIAVPAARGH